MKQKDLLVKEAEEVLEVLGNRIKSESTISFNSSDDINALSNLVDSYSRLYELLK